MADQIHTRHIGTITYQGTEADLRAWGVWPRQRIPTCITCDAPRGDFHLPNCPYYGQVLTAHTDYTTQAG